MLCRFVAIHIVRKEQTSLGVVTCIPRLLETQPMSLVERTY